MAIISDFEEDGPIVSKPKEDDSADVTKSKEEDALDIPMSREEDVPVVPEAKDENASAIPKLKPKEESINGAKGGRVPNSGNGIDFPDYSWVQTQHEATVTVPVPEGTKGRGVAVEITATHLKAGLKGQSPIVAGKLYRLVNAGDSLWTMEDGPRSISVHLTKQKGMEWWKSLIVGEPEIDISKAQPEKTRIGDLDPETRSVVEKMMFDRRQKERRLPTSKELQKREMLEKLKRDNPQLAAQIGGQMDLSKMMMM